MIVGNDKAQFFLLDEDSTQVGNQNTSKMHHNISYLTTRNTVALKHVSISCTREGNRVSCVTQQGKQFCN